MQAIAATKAVRKCTFTSALVRFLLDLPGESRLPQILIIG
jgi:hypothetical protein